MAENDRALRCDNYTYTRAKQRISVSEFTVAAGTRLKTRKLNCKREGRRVGERMNFNLRNSSNAVQVCMSAPLDCPMPVILAVSS